MSSDAVPLFARRHGDAGPDVVILHGLFGSSRNWETVARQLGRRARVHALDLRNHGSSPWSDAMGFPAMAADLLAYLDREGLARAVVIGHSLGGKTAMQAALTQGHRLAGLVVVDIAPVAYRESLLDHVEAVSDVVLAGASRRAEVDEDLSGLIPNPGVRSFILQNLVQEKGRFRWRVNLAALKAHANDLTDFRPPAGTSYAGPTLFVSGGLSPYLDGRRRDAIAPLFPVADLLTIADAGHEVHADNPPAFIAAVSRFLDRVA